MFNALVVLILMQLNFLLLYSYFYHYFHIFIYSMLVFNRHLCYIVRKFINILEQNVNDDVNPLMYFKII